MGKFDNILICSDLDGTLRGSDIKISQKNIEAIKYFMDNGGLFTLSTGRSYGYIDELKREGLFINTVLICLNGAMIYDVSNKKVLYENPINQNDLGDFKGFISKNCEYIKQVLYHSYSQIDDFDDIKDNKLYKIVFIANNEKGAKILRKNLDRSYKEKFFITNSWNTGLEILDKKSTKGGCVKIIKNYIPTKIKKLICIGDYENDIPMLREADISYAVENALPEVKAAADFVTVSNDSDALAEIIYNLG